MPPDCSVRLFGVRDVAALQTLLAENNASIPCFKSQPCMRNRESAASHGVQSAGPPR